MKLPRIQNGKIFHRRIEIDFENKSQDDKPPRFRIQIALPSTNSITALGRDPKQYHNPAQQYHSMAQRGQCIRICDLSASPDPSQLPNPVPGPQRKIYFRAALSPTKMERGSYATIATFFILLYSFGGGVHVNVINDGTGMIYGAQTTQRHKDPVAQVSEFKVRRQSQPQRKIVC